MSVFVKDEFCRPGGLLRLPWFVKDFIQVVRDQQQYRSPETPSLLNPDRTMDDLYTTAVLALLFLTIRILLDKFLFGIIFRRFPPKVQPKLSENLFYSMYYMGAFAFYMFRVRPSLEWSVDLLSNDSHVVKDLVHPYPPHMVASEHEYYNQAGAFYIAASIFLIVFDSRRSDFMEHCLHHFVTLGLVSVSYMYGYVRAGIVILALHDVGDIFLYSAKFVHYLGLAGLDTAVFATFAVTFYVTRLVMFSRLVHMISIETLQTVLVDPGFNKWAMFYDTYLLHYLFFVGFAGTLLLLHCFWFVLILKMIYRELFEGKKISEEGDIRSDDEGDEEIREFEKED
ncbi:LAG1 longevity assurance-like [Gracilariopsis chorda]|uniref:LAG1 longevity assurance-like n=1 Tax=Gracilariopsis chorda TaxID=448386 RepID=A0A2V3IQZ3_9FLOR|nr:LAG1 longevity assurance-like [Gracilariopsis chorda]|eukprot:PXF44528.1 LAG1 longevity assurance-like [Gracilariopsis chorda]